MKDLIQKSKQPVLISILTIFVLLCITSLSLAQVEPWIQKTDILTARFLHSANVVEGKIYLIGGAASEPNAQPVLPVEVYDPIADSCWQKAPIPTGRAVLATAEVDGKIYAIGGVGTDYIGLAAVEMYDPTTDIWTSKADIPTPRGALSTSVVDGKIYAIGGSVNLTNLAGLATVEMYDPATDTWTTKADMPTPRLGLCTAVVNGQIYAIGGGTQSPGVHKVEAYDPESNTWTPKTDMPTARRNFATSVADGKIYAIGGWLRSSNYAFRTVEQYDPVTDNWTSKTDLPVARSCLSASTVNGLIYAVAGTDKTHPCPALLTVYEYDAAADTIPPSSVLNNEIINPTSFALYQNYPNPFNPTTTISYNLCYKAQVKLCVYDLLGREVQVLVNKQQAAGTYNALFNAANLAGGIYFYRLRVVLQNGDRYTDMKKLILIK